MTKRLRITLNAYLVGLLLLAAFRLFSNLGVESLWYDEAYTWWVSSQVSVKESIASSVYEIIPPGSYLLWRGWIALTGETEFAMRALSALMGVITVAALGRTARRMTGSWLVTLVLMGLASLSPALLWAGREVRMYGPLITMCTLSSMALMEVVLTAKHRKRWLWLWALFSLASLYMAITAVFWILAQGMYTLLLTIYYRREASVGQALLKLLRRFALPLLAIAAGFLPWVIAAIPSLGINTGYWPGTLTMDAFFKTAVQGMSVHQYGNWQSGAVITLAAILIVIIAPLPASIRFYPVAAFIAVLMQSRVYHNVPKWGVRHAALYAPILLYMLAIGAFHFHAQFWKKRASWQRWIVLVLLLLSFRLLWESGECVINPSWGFHNEDWRAAAAYVEAQRQPGDLVIIETGSVYPTWVYYAGDEGLLPLPDEKLLNVYNVLNYANTAPILEGVLEQGQQVFVVDWLGDVTDPTDIVGALLEDQGIEQETPDFHGLDVRRYAMTNVHGFPEEPPNVIRLGEELLPGLTLWGMTMPGPVPNDGVLDILTWWQTGDPAVHEGKFYQVSVRLTDALGYTWLQFDVPPGGEYRPERWKPGEVVLGRFQHALPVGLKPGWYDVHMVLYDEQGTTATLEPGGVFVTKGDPRFQLTHPYELVPWSEATGITLAGIKVNQQRIKPGETLSGEVLWRIQGDLVPEYGYEIRLGAYTASFGLIDDLETTLWESYDEFRTSFFLPIPPRALDTQASLEVRLYWDMSEGYTWTTVPVTITANRAFDLADSATPIDVQAGEVATLVGYEVPERVEAGEAFTVTLHWRAGVETDVPLKVFVHVTALDGVMPVVQHDAQPADNARPLYSWVQDEIVTDAHPLEGLPAGNYAVRVGLYGPDGVRLPLHSEAVEVIDDTLSLPQNLVVR